MSILFKEFTHQVKKKYIFGLDLSTVSSGVALYDYEEKRFLETASVIEKGDNKIYEEFKEIINLYEQWQKKYGLNLNNTFIAKEKQPVQYGMKTTIATLVAIAKIHGLVENYFYSRGQMVLDIAVPTIRKEVAGNSRADKEIVYNSMLERYPFQLKGKMGSKDIADAMCVCLTGIVEYRKSCLEEIKELEKELKISKSKQKIEGLREKIKRLENFCIY